MPQGKNYTSFILEEKNSIINFVAKVSTEMFDYIQSHEKSKYVLFYKYITHSDLASFGKATHVNSHAKNLLYYISVDEMGEIENKTNKPFPTAHQSCIGLKTRLYELVGLPDPRANDQYLINDYMNVYLLNKNIEYFSYKYTKKVFEKLNKTISNRSRSWDSSEIDIKLDEGDFTKIDLHVAKHGLGVAGCDDEFHKLRHHIFKGDTLILLFELNNDENNMFILFEKNPLFYSLIGETNKAYVDYQTLLRKRLIDKTIARDNAVISDDTKEIDDEVTRQQQATWRKMLANEMMGYTQTFGEVFCPMTYITLDFDKLGTLFVASHIKGFSDPNTTNDEKYDINNGLLLSANADALFDKHLITINENKQLEFSFLLDTDIRLKSQLLLMQPIFTPILNEKRMEYLKYHYSVFQDKELKRRSA